MEISKPRSRVNLEHNSNIWNTINVCGTLTGATIYFIVLLNYRSDRRASLGAISAERWNLERPSCQQGHINFTNHIIYHDTRLLTAMANMYVGISARIPAGYLAGYLWTSEINVSEAGSIFDTRCCLMLCISAIWFLTDGTDRAVWPRLRLRTAASVAQLHELKSTDVCIYGSWIWTYRRKFNAHSKRCVAEKLTLYAFSPCCLILVLSETVLKQSYIPSACISQSHPHGS